MAQSRDQEIWEEAKRNNWVIIAKDEDFVVFSGIDPSGSPVIWLRVGNYRRQYLLNGFGAFFPSILDELPITTVFLEPRHGPERVKVLLLRALIQLEFF